jgi:hypothetical protein
MQRTALLPIVDFVREAEAVGRSPAELRLLEVAAGTGRFHTFIKAGGVRATAAGLLSCRPVLLLRHWMDMRGSSDPDQQLQVLTCNSVCGRRLAPTRAAGRLPGHALRGL